MLAVHRQAGRGKVENSGGLAHGCLAACSCLMQLSKTLTQAPPAHPPQDGSLEHGRGQRFICIHHFYGVLHSHYDLHRQVRRHVQA